MLLAVCLAMQSSLKIYETLSIYDSGDAVGLYFKFMDIQSQQIEELMTTFEIKDLSLQFGKGITMTLDKDWMDNASATGANLFIKTNQALEPIYSVLSGLFCASINSIETSSVFNGFHHGRLPQETVCTENLSLFVRLLPCANRMGLSELLNPIVFMDSHYLGLSITSTVINDKVMTTIAIQVILKKNNHNDLLSLLKLSKNTITLCPPSDLSISYHSVKKIELNSRTNSDQLNLENINFNSKSELVLSELYHYIKYSSWLGGFGDDSGTLITVVENQSDLETINVVYYEQIPWYFRLYLHTSQWESNNKDHTDFITKFLFLPGKDRIQPNVLEYHLRIPPKTQLVYSIQFEKGFLRYKEYKPDAHRGLDFGYCLINLDLQHSL